MRRSEASTRLDVFCRPIFLTWSWTAFLLVRCVNCAPTVINSLIPGQNESDEQPVNYTEALAHYTYGIAGPATWFHIFKACGGYRQSPIDIDTVVSERMHHPHLFWWNYHLKPSNMTLTNNGHTVILSGHWAPGLQPYFWHATDVDGEKNYVLDSIHFHWGNDDTHGSEHLINNVSYPLELHAVHYNKHLSSVGQALQLNSGVAVISVFFMISENHNSGLDGVVSGLPHVLSPTSVVVTPIEVGRLIPRFSKGYITYNGSLTTPPCAEAVTWLIRLTPATISKQQLAEFRKLRDHTGGFMAGNYRPVQPINGRQVRHVI